MKYRNCATRIRWLGRLRAQSLRPSRHVAHRSEWLTSTQYSILFAIAFLVSVSCAVLVGAKTLFRFRHRQLAVLVRDDPLGVAHRPAGELPHAIRCHVAAMRVMLCVALKGMNPARIMASMTPTVGTNEYLLDMPSNG